MTDRLVALGAVVVELPTIDSAPPEDGGSALRAAMERALAGAYAWIVVTSATTVEQLVAFQARLGDLPVRWAAVGAATARALEETGVTVDLVPSESVGEAVVTAFPVAPDHGGALLFPRAAEVRPVVADGLRTRGWVVDEVVAYRTVAAEADPSACALARTADVVAFTSSSTVRATIDLLGLDHLPPLVASIGPVTSATARSLGLTVAVEADPHDLDGLVAALLSL